MPTPPRSTSASPARSVKSDKSAGSAKSTSSVASIKSQLSVLSEDSFKKATSLDSALVKILDDQNYFATRKILSHHSKKPDEKRVDKNVKFEGASAKLNADYEAYKAEVNKIKPAETAYTTLRKTIKGPPSDANRKVREQCIVKAQAWCDQGVRAGMMRTKFLQDHKAELVNHLCFKSYTDHITQGQLNIKAAQKAMTELRIQEEKIVELTKMLAAAEK
ncbi:hypothetical protein diail_2292 [Diaporthe ilicicola]|nr:hypothetical protein diail_2292 [Diaporthe ilicicola]